MITPNDLQVIMARWQDVRWTYGHLPSGAAYLQTHHGLVMADDEELANALRLAHYAPADVRALLEEVARLEAERDAAGVALLAEEARLERCLDADTATRHGRALANAAHNRLGALLDDNPDSPIVAAYWFFMAALAPAQGEPE